LIIGRLKRNVSFQAASADLGVIAKLSEKDYPAWFRAWGTYKSIPNLRKLIEKNANYEQWKRWAKE
jgi:hypothetical protein